LAAKRTETAKIAPQARIAEGVLLGAPEIKSGFVPILFLMLSPQDENLRQAVGFGSEAHRNRYDCPAGKNCRGSPAGRARN